jgi:hypothetical protein
MAASGSVDLAPWARTFAYIPTGQQVLMQYVHLPITNIAIPKQQLPFYVGLSALALLDIVDWPMALVIMAGHLIAENAHRQGIRELSEALSEAA